MKLMLRALCMLVLILSAGRAGAQTGLPPTDFEALEKLRAWEPEPTAYAENFAVDLRDRLPPFGKQSMGDCAAWTFGYAGKSFLEANDQGWRPDRPARIFSPTFIYNSLATGEQSGLTPIAVLNFLKTQGCATLATTPYLTRDYNTKPSSRAKEEAALFRIADFALLKDGPAMRTALQQGHIVLIGVRTNPVFNGGRYDIYNAELHKQGHSQRKDGQLHGFHALTVAGFDDSKEAFLIMNSWGERWGKNGFCWVHYNVARTHNRKKDNIESNLIDWAIVMYDVKEKVEIGADGVAVNRPVDKTTLQATGRAEYRGYDAQQKRHVFFFNAALTGQAKALDLVKSVEWSYDRLGTKQSLTATSRFNSFAVSASSVSSDIDVQGKIDFKDGTSRDVTLKLTTTAPQADDRDLKFNVDVRYWGKNNAGTPLWYYEITPRLSARDVNDVVKAVWDRSELVAPGDRDRIYTLDGNGTSSPKYTGPSGITARPAKTKVRYHFADGAVKDMVLDIPTDDPIDETFRIETEWQEDGVDAAGRTVYSFQSRLRMPHREFYFQDDVKWDLGPGMEPRHPHAHTYNNFTVSGTTTRDFRVRCSLKHRDGTRKTYEKWVELGASARFTNPHRLALDSTDVYLGRVNGTPMWRVRLLPVGDLASFERIREIVYTMPKGYSTPTVTVSASPDTDFSTHIWANKSVTVPAKIVFNDGNYTLVETSATPRAPVFDGVHLQAAYTGSKLDERPVARFDISGAKADLDRIVAVDYFFTHKGRFIHAPVRGDIVLWPHLYGLYATPDAGTSPSALLTFSDGWQQRIDTARAVTTDPIAMQNLHLQVRERFHGIDAGRGRYAAQALVAGEGALLDRIATVDYTIDVPDMKPLQLRADKPWQPLTLTLNGPGRITALVTFKPEANLAPVTLTARTRAAAPRTAKPLVLREFKQPWNTEQQRWWMVSLDGWASALEQISHVTYNLPKSLAPAPVVVKADSDALAPFAYRGTSTTPIMVEATVTKKDGTTEQLTLEVGGPMELLWTTVQTRYWGVEPKINATAPAHELIFTTIGQLNLRQAQPTTSNAWGDTLATSPLGMRRILVSKANPWDVSNVEYFNKNTQYLAQPIDLTKTGEDNVRLLVLPPKTGEKEFVIAMVGPERLLSKVRTVTYRLGDKDLLTLRGDERYSDRLEDFALRLTRDEKPAVSAVITFLDNTAPITLVSDK